MSYFPKEYLAYPVLIEIKKTFGTGFFARNGEYIFLVTAQHVLFHLQGHLYDKHLTMKFADGGYERRAVFELDCEYLFSQNELRKSNVADVAMVRIGKIVSGGFDFYKGVTPLEQPSQGIFVTGMDSSNMLKFDDVEISNDAIVFGYPTTLAKKKQLDVDRPLLRRGSISGKTTGRKIVIDCATYQGNSGGLVVEHKPELNHFRGIGIVSQMVPFVEELRSAQYPEAISTRFENSGYTIVEPMDHVLDLFK